MTSMSVMVYRNQWPKINKVALIAVIMATLVVMKVMILMIYGFEGYNFPNSSIAVLTPTILIAVIVERA